MIVGAGAYGAYCAAKLYRNRPSKRVLLLDAGSLLVTEHVQNLGRVGLDVPAPIPPASDSGIPRALVWGLPWRGNVDFPGVAYCAGGKSIYWGGWCPRLTSQDLLQWPSSVSAYLNANYSEVESETGVVPATDFIFGELHSVLFPRVVAATPGVSNIETAIGNNGVEVAPLAVQGSPPVSGLFSFDKYSSLPLLINAIREDVVNSGLNNANRRLFFVPRAHVTRLRSRRDC